MELVLEQTQQGTSYEISISDERVEELKRKVKIEGEKKEALITLRQKPVKMEILLEPTSNKLSVGDFQKDYKVKYKAFKAELALITQSIDVVSKNKSEKVLIAESFDWDEESLSSEDEGVTRVKAFMAIAKDELVVGKTDARSCRWVEITMKKVQRLLSMNDGDERKQVLDYTNVDLHYVKDQRKNFLSKFNSLKQELSSWGRRKRKETVSLKEFFFNKGENSPFETTHDVTSDPEFENNNQESLSSLPKLSATEPIGTSIMSYHSLT
nr:hypothetical protein [Tanacetum cinerariifolium]